MPKLPRIKTYEKMGLGLMIHWGLYSQLAQGEWTEFIHNRPKDSYEDLIHSFSARKFSASKIVKAAKEMGAKYIVLTTKHHEGFCLFDTHDLTDFDVMHSPAHRDLIQEFVAACHREKIKPFFYMATYDWHQPDYEKNFDRYLVYLRKTVQLLCQNYGSIGGFWFDGDWNKKDADWQLPKLYGMIRKYQPDAIIVNNTGLKSRGQVRDSEIDVVTYERTLPQMVNHEGQNQKYVAGETSMTLNQHWGWAINDLNYKSPKEIIEAIVHARRIGCNILINIGLTGDGDIPNLQAEYLKLIGRWFNLNGQSFYHEPDHVLPGQMIKDYGLQTSHHIYFFIHDLKIVGNENVVLGGEKGSQRFFSGITKKISDLHWLDNNEKLVFQQVKDKFQFTATGYHYGTDEIVRVAVADLEAN